MIRRLIRRLFPPDCDECGRYASFRMHGNFWHADTCSGKRYYRDTSEGDDE